MANVITNDNIRDLVRDYVENRNNLPAWLQGIPISDWDVSRVTNMNNLFRNLTTFNEPLTNWDVSNVTTMLHMFYGCSNFNQPLGNWNVSNVTYMLGMFILCLFMRSSIWPVRGGGGGCLFFFFQAEDGIRDTAR